MSRRTPTTLPTLAISLPLEKALLVLSLWWLHGQVSADAGVLAVLPEAGVGAILLSLFLLTKPGSLARRIATALGWLLFFATWIAIGSWAFTGTLVPYRLVLPLMVDPAILRTGIESDDLVLSLAGWTLGWLALLAVAAVLASAASRLLHGRVVGKRWAVVAAVSGVAAIAFAEGRAAPPLLERLAMAAASGEGETLASSGAKLDPIAVAALAPFDSPALAPTPVRNVVVLVLESIRFGEKSPFVRGFPEAVHFNRVYAHQPRSVKTLEALLFGIYPSPWRETASWSIDQYDLGAIGALPALLREHGFETSYFGAMDMNFENYQSALEAAGIERNERVMSKDKLTWGVSARALFARVFETLEAGAEADRRQLVIAWTSECHRPYDSASTGIAAGSDLDRYHACERTLADAVQELLARLAASGMLEDTLVVAFGDHGQLFPEDHPGHSAYGQHVYESSLHVPLLIFAPRGLSPIPPGTADDRLFQLVDVPTTVAAAAGVSPPASWVGGNLLDPAVSGREFVVLVSMLDPAVLGLVEESKRKVAITKSGGLVAYDLSSDPREQRGVEVSPEQTARDRAKLVTYVAMADQGWRNHLVADKAHQMSFDGLAVEDFGRFLCLNTTPDPEERSLRIAPSDHEQCTKRRGRPREIVRQLPVAEIAGAAELRVDVRLRLDEKPPSAELPKMRVRLGGRQTRGEQAISPEPGRWQDVSLTIPLGELATAEQASQGGTVPFALTPVDGPLRFSLAAIRLEPLH